MEETQKYWHIARIGIFLLQEPNSLDLEDKFLHTFLKVPLLSLFSTWNRL